MEQCPFCKGKGFVIEKITLDGHGYDIFSRCQCPVGKANEKLAGWKWHKPKNIEFNYWSGHDQAKDADRNRRGER